MKEKPQDWAAMKMVLYKIIYLSEQSLDYDTRKQVQPEGNKK